MFVDNVNFITLDNIITNHMLIRHEKAKGLLVMLPGGNNISDRPIMHYLRKVMLDEGYDVLNMDYTGLINNEKSFDNNCNDILDVVKEVLLKIKDNYRNLEISMFCRSLGSFVGAKLANASVIDFHKVVIISPTSSTVSEIDSLECKFYFDRKDKYLSSESYELLISKPNVTYKEYKDGGHNFEIDNNIEETIEIMKDVVLDMSDYLIN